MDEIYTYRLEVQGRVDEKEFNAMSPMRAVIVRSEPGATCFAVSTDQSGIIGLIRHLHRRGFILLSIYRERLR